MSVRKYISSEWRKIRDIGSGSQGSLSLVQHVETGEMAVQKLNDKMYKVVGGTTIPLAQVILHQILPPSRRIVHLKAATTDPDQNRAYGVLEIFEYCKGGDLQRAMMERWDRGPSESFIWHCFVQIAEALDVVHNGGSKGVVHGDIKPDNIFLEAKLYPQAPWPNLKLGDFGCAVAKEYGNGIHVPCWQGPELPLLSRPGDMWGLGAIIHWLGHGEPPVLPPPAGFRGSRYDWELIPEARKPRALPRQYSRMLNQYMLDCLEWDTRDRVSSRGLADNLKRDRPRLG